jgi:hypothetical protein
VSDKMKSKGKQAYSCFEKDQSFHLFGIPWIEKTSTNDYSMLHQ